LFFFALLRSPSLCSPLLSFALVCFSLFSPLLCSAVVVIVVDVVDVVNVVVVVAVVDDVVIFVA
jgi:hypothetical protein